MIEDFSKFESIILLQSAQRVKIFSKLYPPPSFTGRTKDVYTSFKLSKF